MKQTKKLFSIVLAIALVFAMAIPAFAAEQTGNIVINSANGISVGGKVFKAYKILDAAAVDTDNLEAGVIYSIPAAMQGFYNTKLGKTDTDATVADVETYINNLDADALLAFAKDALVAAKAAGVKAEETTGVGEKATFADIPFGYYVIEDTTDSKVDGSIVSAVMLDTTNDVELNLKADKPSIIKKIDGDKDIDVTTDDLVDYNTALVGEKVPYVLQSKVPDMTGYTSYTYYVTDTFSDGLTFNNDIAITVGDKTLVKDTDFTVAQAGQVVTITFVNFLQYKNVKGADITITYTATVNENAVIGVEGNPNTVNLTYSNNPQDNASNDTTPDDTVVTYLVDLIINKTDEDNKPLADAEFAVKQGNTVIATGTSKADGKVVFTWVNGVALKDGETYTIEETAAPEGYNLADPITFTVTCEDPKNPETSLDCTWKSSNDKVTFTATAGADVDDYFETTIINTTGSLLPETGGMGTTMFYMIGAMMVAAAVVLLVSKKRMAFEA